MELDDQNVLSREDATFSRRTETVLRDMVLNGTLQPGERLNEVALAQALGISRGPLREAIQRLSGEGLLRLVSHRGAFVRTFERREVEELYDLRTALEMYVVRLVCQRATDEQIEDLAGMLRETGAALEQDPSAAYPTDRDLHQRLIEIADNQALARAAVEVQRQLMLARRRSAQGPERARQALGEHDDLLAAIIRRDEDQAALEMRRHLGQARLSALAALGLPAP